MLLGLRGKNSKFFTWTGLWGKSLKYFYKNNCFKFKIFAKSDQRRQEMVLKNRSWQYKVRLLSLA